ncbi:hypothetical protein HMPREF2955_14725 [Prevotella sp. HMSC073D09]|uniref:hypothetical protein n=1 Tax=Prevotella sp. HMSC073D09 TaxID=1739459 RepID=UPI0008A2B0D9|nr:hypothetical protein [Prevotella sp. HMSC073D09]OFQ11656.1 hypothetical protein HMPREF2955_14725 [Prevotella sp. HMSC073D09]
MRIVEMARNDIKNSSLLKTKFLIYAFNGRTLKNGVLGVKWGQLDLKKHEHSTKIERLNGAKRKLFSQKETKQKT